MADVTINGTGTERTPVRTDEFEMQATGGGTSAHCTGQHLVDMVIPVLTTTARDALASPPEGMLVYNSTTHKLNVRVAAAWEAITSA